MTRKDYVAIAAALKAQNSWVVGDNNTRRLHQHAQWCRDVQAVADVFARDNARFDRQKFLVAAGLAS